MWISVRRESPEIDVVPTMIGLPEVYHADVRGWEGWCFTGPERSSDIVARLKRDLIPRGWTYSKKGSLDSFHYMPRSLFGEFLSLFRLSRNNRSQDPISITVETGRILTSPPARPLSGDWTAVRMNSPRAVEYSGPGPYPGWNTYR